MAALQRVLQLQRQLAPPAQGAEVESVIAVGLAQHDELFEPWPPHSLPPRTVVGAEKGTALGPQRAVRQRALRMAGIVDGFDVGEPCLPFRLSSALPEPVVADAQALADASETAAGHQTDGQLLAPEAPRGRLRGEFVEVGAAFGDPPVVMALAQAAGARLPDTVGHPTRCSVEHQRAAIGHQDLGPELRADRGHQLAQQPRRRRPVLLESAHHRTSLPVRNPAASKARRASSTER